MTSQSSAAIPRRIAEPTIPLWPATQTRLHTSEYTAISRFFHDRGRLHHLEIGLDHLAREFAHTRSVPPSKLDLGLRRVADQQVDLGRPEIARIDFDQQLSGLRVEAFFSDAGAFPFQRDAGVGEGPLHKVRSEE